jgi:regulator of replication initiation timing
MGILDSAKDVAKAVQEINNLELYKRVLDLHSDIIELVEANNLLRTENKDLKATLELREKMVFKEPFYYQDGDQTPFCPACWETKNTPVHVTFIFDNRENTRWDCPSCKHGYLISKKNRGTSSGSIEFGGQGGPGGWMR